MKKARKIKAGLAEAEKEIAEGEKKMEEWAERFSARKAIRLADIDRTEVMESFADDLMMLRNTSLIPTEMLEPFVIRRALGVQRILKRSRVAAAAEVAAAEAEVAAFIAVTVTAAAEIAVAEAAAAALAEEATAAFAAVVAAASAEAAAEVEAAATQDAFDASAAQRAGGFWGDEEIVGEVGVGGVESQVTE